MGVDMRLAETDDRDLVMILGHNADALEEFYRRHVRGVTRFVARSVGDSHDTADLVAATFVAVIESAHRYDPQRGEPRAWLYGIAGNIVAGRFRRGAAESRAMAAWEGRSCPPPDDYEVVDNKLDAARSAGPALEMVRSLPPTERELIDLMLRGDLSLAEAARVLGIRPGTARMRWSRARAKLAVALTAGGR
jgi:RNA polymerase sigma factor (sigma-70 family)